MAQHLHYENKGVYSMCKLLQLVLRLIKPLLLTNHEKITYNITPSCCSCLFW